MGVSVVSKGQDRLAGNIRRIFPSFLSGGGEPEVFEDFLNLLQFALPCGNGKHPQKCLYKHILYDFYRADFLLIRFFGMFAVPAGKSELEKLSIRKSSS
jgi:hypothetical protein